MPPPNVKPSDRTSNTNTPQPSGSSLRNKSIQQSVGGKGGGGSIGLPCIGGGTKMGNGASASNVNIVIDGETLDLARIKTMIPDLKAQLRDKDKKIQQLSSELDERLKEIDEREADISRLKEEVHKLKSVLQLKVDYMVPGTKSKPDLLAAIAEDATTSVDAARLKKQGVSAESPTSNTLGPVEIKHHEKDFRSEVYRPSFESETSLTSTFESETG